MRKSTKKDVVVLVSVLVLLGFAVGIFNFSAICAIINLTHIGQYTAVATPVLYTFWRGGYERNNKPGMKRGST